MEEHLHNQQLIVQKNSCNSYNYTKLNQCSLNNFINWVKKKVSFQIILHNQKKSIIRMRIKNHKTINNKVLKLKMWKNILFWSKKNRILEIKTKFKNNFKNWKKFV